MSNRKQGRRAGYGWTIEELLHDSASTSEGQYLAAKKASLKNKLTSQVINFFKFIYDYIYLLIY